MFRKLLLIVIGLMFIYFGLTGTAVLRGTNSSGSLVIAGILLFLYGIWSINAKPKNNKPLIDENPIIFKYPKISEVDEETEKLINFHLISKWNQYTTEQKAMQLYEYLYLLKHKNEAKSWDLKSLERNVRIFPITIDEIKGAISVYENRKIIFRKKPKELIRTIEAVDLLVDYGANKFNISREELMVTMKGKELA